PRGNTGSKTPKPNHQTPRHDESVRWRTGKLKYPSTKCPRCSLKFGVSLFPGAWGLGFGVCHRLEADATSPLELERYRRERRQIDQDRMFATHPGGIFAILAAQIPNITSSVGFTVGIDDFAIK